MLTLWKGMGKNRKCRNICAIIYQDNQNVQETVGLMAQLSTK